MSLLLSGVVAAALLGVGFTLFVLIALQRHATAVARLTTPSRDRRTLAAVIQIDQARQRRRA